MFTISTFNEPIVNRPRHSKKEIEAALQYAESKGWRVVKAAPKAKPWGRILCELADRTGCTLSVHSTPRVPEHHAAKITKTVDNCSCKEGDDDDDT